MACLYGVLLVGCRRGRGNRCEFRAFVDASPGVAAFVDLNLSAATNTSLRLTSSRHQRCGPEPVYEHVVVTNVGAIVWKENVMPKSWPHNWKNMVEQNSETHSVESSRCLRVSSVLCSGVLGYHSSARKELMTSWRHHTEEPDLRSGAGAMSARWTRRSML
jgi:hypothetical protein